MLLYICSFRFFEWQTKEKGAPKQPYYIYFKKDVAHECAGKAEKEEKTEVSQQLLGEHKELLTMAGLFDCWKAPKVLTNLPNLFPHPPPPGETLGMRLKFARHTLLCVKIVLQISVD